MRNFKQISIAVVLLLFVFAFSIVVRADYDYVSATEKGKQIETTYNAPAPKEVKEVFTTEVPEPTPEPKFYYSKFIRVMVTQTEKDEIETELLNYEKEIEMISKVIYREARRSIIPLSGKAAVAWVILNRFDNGNYGDSIEQVITAPHQFAWVEDTPSEDWEWLARDVITRWLLEKKDYKLVGRTIPSDWYFFAGRNGINYFRQEYRSRTYWDWSMSDPYLGLPYPDDPSVIIDMFTEEQKCSSVNAIKEIENE